MKILEKCDFRKILEHLYSKETEKFSQFKKIKLGKIFPEIYTDEEEEELSDYEQDLIDKEEYKEMLNFENERAKILTKDEYLSLNESKSTIFGGKNKKLLFKYLIDLCDKEKINLSNEIKDSNNMELLAFIIKKRLKKIVSNANKKRNKGELKVLTKPLTIDELTAEVDEEINYLDEFLSDYSQSIYLIEAFSKKKNNPKGNKNIKIKRNGESTLLIIKKTAFSSEDLTVKYKAGAEKKVINYFKQQDYFSYKEREKGNNKLFITKEKITDSFKLENFYEFFLLSYFIEDLFNLNQNLYQINKENIHKLDKKFLDNKFTEWCIKMTEYERQSVKELYDLYI